MKRPHRNRDGKTNQKIVDEVMDGLEPDECLEAAEEFEAIAAIIRQRVISKNGEPSPIKRLEGPIAAELCQPGRFPAAKFKDEGVCLALFKDGVALDVVEFTPAEFAVLKSKALSAGGSFGELLLKTADAMAAENVDLDLAAAPKNPRGFVMLNLSEQEKKELRKLARASGQELRGALRNALTDLKEHLKEWARLKRLTGLDSYEQFRLFGHGSKLN